MTPKQRKAKNAYERERRRLHRMHHFENAARGAGFYLIGGVDEVGRGPLAGPVVAACVVAAEPLFIKGLNDSKQVRPEVRVTIAEIIKTRVAAWAVGSRVRGGDRSPQHLLGQRAGDGASHRIARVGAGVSDHRRRAHPLLRRTARTADTRRRALRGRRRRVDYSESAS